MASNHLVSDVFTELPAVGAWRLLGAYEGFEVARFIGSGKGMQLEGTSVGVEDGKPWAIHYSITVTERWHFHRAIVTDQTGGRVEIEIDAEGSWFVNGLSRPDLRGCLDLDLEASAVTNTCPVHRLQLRVGDSGESAAAYIRTNGLAVERLDQAYRRLPDVNGGVLFDYQSPRFEYRDTLHFGSDGLAVNYPGIAARVPLTDHKSIS